MKKNIILAMATVAFLGASTLSASTTDALTKATVKLIKENQLMFSKIKENKDLALENKQAIEEIKVFYKESKLVSGDNGEKMTSISKNFDAINSSIKNISDNEKISKEEREKFKLSFEQLKGQIKVLQEKSGISDETINKNMKKDADDAKEKEAQIKKLNAVIEELKSDNKILEDKFDDFVAKTNAKLKLVDAKASKSPLTILEKKSVIKECESGNCGSSTEEDSVIKNFLAN